MAPRRSIVEKREKVHVLAYIAEGGEIDAASQASAHLPFDLTMPTKMISQIEKELAERETPDL